MLGMTHKQRSVEIAEFTSGSSIRLNVRHRTLIGSGAGAKICRASRNVKSAFLKEEILWPIVDAFSALPF